MFAGNEYDISRHSGYIDDLCFPAFHMLVHIYFCTDSLNLMNRLGLLIRYRYTKTIIMSFKYCMGLQCSREDNITLFYETFVIANIQTKGYMAKQ